MSDYREDAEESALYWARLEEAREAEEREVFGRSTPADMTCRGWPEGRKHREYEADQAALDEALTGWYNEDTGRYEDTGKLA
jgi:hypothetical protein